MSTIEIKAEFAEVKNADAALDGLTKTGHAAAGAADRVKESTRGMNGAAADAAQQIDRSTEAHRKHRSAVNENVTASQRLTQQFDRSKRALADYITEQVRAGRSISAAGQVMEANGRINSAATVQMAKLRDEYINVANTADDVTDSLNRVASGTRKHAAAAAESAQAEARLQAEIEQTEARLKREAVAARAAARAYGSHAGAADTVRKTTGNATQRLAQAGIQVEQLTTSITAGANAAQAFAFQAADLGIVLGAPLVGSIVAITAALAGPFLTSLFDTESAADTLSNTLEVLRRSASVGSGGVLEITDALRELSTVSQDATEGRIRNALNTAEQAVRDGTGAIKEALVDAFDINDELFGVIDITTLEDAIRTARSRSAGESEITLDFRVGDMGIAAVAENLGESLGAAEDKARDVGATVIEMLATIDREGTPESIVKLEEFLNEQASAAGHAEGKVRTFLSTLEEYFDGARGAADAAKLLNEQLNSGEQVKDPAAVRYAEAVESLRTSLEGQIIALEDGERAAAKYNAALSLGLDSALELDPAIAGMIDKIYDNRDAAQAAADAKKDEAEANRQLRAELAAEVKARRDAAQEAQKWSQFQNGLAAEGNPAEQARQQYEARLDVIREHYGLVDSLQAASTAEGMKALELYEKKLEDIKDKAEKGGFFDTLSSDLESMGRQASGAAASVALGFTDAEDAAASLVRTVSTQLLGAMIQWGVESVIAAAKSALAVKGSEAAKTAAITASTTTQATAAVTATQTVAGAQVAAGTQITAAMAPAAAASSVATAGGSAALGTMVAIGAIGAIIGALLAGSRAQGGDVSAGKMYRINEWNQEYFIPSTNGKIVPQHAMPQGGGGGGQPINVVMNFGGGSRGEFARPTSRRRIESATYRGISRAYARNH